MWLCICHLSSLYKRNRYDKEDHGKNSFCNGESFMYGNHAVSFYMAIRIANTHPDSSDWLRVGLILCSTAVAIESRSTVEGTMRVLAASGCTVAPVTVA